MATSFRFLYRTARNACLCRCCKSLFPCRRRPATDRKQKSVYSNCRKPVGRVDFDVGGCETSAPQMTCDVTGVDDSGKELLATGGVLPIDSCVAAVGVDMACVATSNATRRQSTIVRLTRLRQQIGLGLHSADHVRVPIWLSLLLVVVYIALGAVMFSAWESVGVTSESTITSSATTGVYWSCDIVTRVKIVWQRANGAPIWGERSSYRESTHRWYHSKDRWWFPIGCPL